MTDRPFNLFWTGSPPDCPRSSTWSELLHWCVAVMDADDTHLPFAASLLADAIRKGGLTEKQARYASRTLEHVTELHRAGLLACQTLRLDAGNMRSNAQRDGRPSLSVIEGGVT